MLCLEGRVCCRLTEGYVDGERSLPHGRDAPHTSAGSRNYTRYIDVEKSSWGQQSAQALLSPVGIRGICDTDAPGSLICTFRTTGNQQQPRPKLSGLRYVLAFIETVNLHEADSFTFCVQSWRPCGEWRLPSLSTLSRLNPPNAQNYNTATF